MGGLQCASVASDALCFTRMPCHEMTVLAGLLELVSHLGQHFALSLMRALSLARLFCPACAVRARTHARMRTHTYPHAYAHTHTHAHTCTKRTKRTPHLSHPLQLLSGLMEVMSNCPTDDLDTLFRGLVATATLLMGDRALAELAKELGVQVCLLQACMCMCVRACVRARTQVREGGRGTHG